MEYGDYWRQHRRLFHQHFRPVAVPQYHSRQAKGVRRLLRSLLDTPEDFLKHIRLYVTCKCDMLLVDLSQHGQFHHPGYRIRARCAAR